jgi:hypothetical protein
LKGTTVLPVDIMGMNMPQYGQSSGMYAGKPLSWMRDNATLNVTASWGAVFRDIIILDPANGKVEAFNASTYPLDGAANAANRTALKNKLIAAATPADTDNDRLPDYWERLTYGNLSRNGASIHTGGITTLIHYAHGGAGPGPTPPDGLPRIVGLPDGTVSVFYTRRRGTCYGLTCLPEFSDSLNTWSANAAGWEEWSLRPLYDGSGGEVVEWKILQPGAAQFVRIRSALP